MIKVAGLLLAVNLIFTSCQQRVDPAAGCQLTITEGTNRYAYQFDEAGKLTAIHTTSASGEVDFRYTYEGNQATIDVTYPKADWLRIRYDLNLNEQGYAVTAQETMFNRLADGTTRESVINTHTFVYNAGGYLVNHQADNFSYPPGADKIIKHSGEHLTYRDGNPVTIEIEPIASGTAQPARTIVTSYGQQPNPLQIPFLVESNPFGFSISRYLQPFLGKPAQHLLTASDNQEAGRPTTSTAYTYQLDSGGKLISVNRTGLYSIGSSLESSCP